MTSPEDIAEVWRSRVDAVRDMVVARLKEHVARLGVGAVISSDGGQVAVAGRGQDDAAPAPSASKAGHAPSETAATKHNAGELVSLKDRIMDPVARSDSRLLRRGGGQGIEHDHEAARMVTVVRSDFEPDLKRLAIEALGSGQE